MSETPEQEAVLSEILSERLTVAQQEAADWKLAFETSNAEVGRLTEELAKATTGLQKIDAIRNSIIGLQNINWSAHIYPLVAALKEAGYSGEGYDVSRDKALTLLQQKEAAEASRDQLAASLRTSERLRLEDATGKLDAETSLREMQEQIKVLLGEMAHEIFRCGNHPALGVDVEIVAGWGNRVRGLAALPQPAAPPKEG